MKVNYFDLHCTITGSNLLTPITPSHTQYLTFLRHDCEHVSSASSARIIHTLNLQLGLIMLMDLGMILHTRTLYTSRFSNNQTKNARNYS